MKLLLDTHAFLWWLDGDKKLPPRVRKVLADDANDIFISAASAWEVTTKFRIGKLPQAEEVARQFGKCIIEQGFTALPISIQHAEHAGLLIGEHRDPFDRMLIAQAFIDRLTLITNEAIFTAFQVETFW